MSVVPFNRSSTEIYQPRAIDVEQALIGACLLNSEAFDVASDLVLADDFYEPLHRNVWQAMAAARAEGRRIEFRLVAAALGPDAHRKIDGIEMTAAQYVAHLASNAVSVNDAPDFARTIRDHADGRRLASVAADISEQLERGGPAVAPTGIAASAIERLDAVMQSRTKTSTPRVSIGEAAARALDEAREMAAGGKRRGLTTGLPSLDRMLLGLRESKLYIVAGRPGMGKTMAALCMAQSIARTGAGVYFVSLEMDDKELVERAISNEAERFGARITYQDIAANAVRREDLRAFERAYESVETMPMQIETEPGLNMAQISARAQQVRMQMERRGVRLGAIFIDHMGLVTSSTRYRGNKVAETGEISNAQKRLAKQFGLPVISLCQLSRDVESRDDKRPMLSDLRWAGEIEQDADVILFPFREVYYLARDKSPDAATRMHEVEDRIEIEVAKNRGGPLGRIDCLCLPGCNVIREMGGAQ